MRYYGAYEETIENLCRIVEDISHLAEAEKTDEQAVYLHYFTEMADYFISGYDGDNTMNGTTRSTVFPDGTVKQKISLTNIKSNKLMKLDFSWEGDRHRVAVTLGRVHYFTHINNYPGFL